MSTVSSIFWYLLWPLPSLYLLRFSFSVSPDPLNLVRPFRITVSTQTGLRTFHSILPGISSLFTCQRWGHRVLNIRKSHPSEPHVLLVPPRCHRPFVRTPVGTHGSPPRLTPVNPRWLFKIRPFTSLVYTQIISVEVVTPFRKGWMRFRSSVIFFFQD